jgi:methionyl-tRNA formyltransferase
VRVIFYGSGRFAIPSFEALVGAGHDVAAAVTQPDREKGRGRSVSPPPLKPVALARGVPVLQPPRVRHAVEELSTLRPELQVVVAYGQILPRAVIDLAPLGTVNVHGSLLPRYRGAAPIQWAIARSEARTGVTTMLIDEGLDTGPILLQSELAIGPGETAADLEPRLAEAGAGLLLETVDGLASGAIQPRPQDHDRATLAPLLSKRDGAVDWTLDAAEIEARIRGFVPWPGVRASCRGRSLRLLQAEPTRGQGSPGQVIAVGAEGIVVACARGSALRLLEVQPESKRAMDAAAFARGAHLEVGESL